MDEKKEPIFTLYEDNPEKIDPKKARSKFLRRYVLPPVVVLICLMFGSASTVVFWEPSMEYAQTSELGQWLTGLLHFNSGYVLFASGALDIAALSMYGSLKAGPEFIQYIRKQPSFAEKFFKASAIILFAVMQGLQIPAVAFGTGSSLPFIITAGIGSFPNAFLAATNLVRRDIPNLGTLLRRLYLSIRTCFSEPDILDQYQAEKLLYKFHHRFICNLKAAQLELRRKKKFVKEIWIYQHHREMWFAIVENAGVYPKESHRVIRAHNIVKTFLQFLAVLLWVCLLASLTMSNMMYSIMPKFIENHILDIILGALLCIGGVYLFFKLVTDTIGGVYEILKSILKCQPVNELGFQLYPIAKSVVFVLGTLWSLLSFPTVQRLFQNNYYGPFPDELSINVCIAIIFFHICSIMHLFDIGAKRATESQGKSNSDKYSLIQEYSAVEYAEYSSPKDVMIKVYQLEASQKEKLLGSKKIAQELSSAVMVLQRHELYYQRYTEEESRFSYFSEEAAKLTSVNYTNPNF